MFLVLGCVGGETSPHEDVKFPVKQRRIGAAVIGAAVATGAAVQPAKLRRANIDGRHGTSGHDAAEHNAGEMARRILCCLPFILLSIAFFLCMSILLVL